MREITELPASLPAISACSYPEIRALGDAALQAGNSESIIKRHYLNLHPCEEGGQFFRIMPDPKRRRAVLAPVKETNPNPHLVAV